MKSSRRRCCLRHGYSLRALAVLAILVTAESTGAQHRAAPLRRSDVAFAYLRFETALASSDQTPESTAQLNRDFDRAVGQFFTGELETAARYLNEAAWRLMTGRDPSGVDRAILSHVARFEPPVAAKGADEEVSLMLRPVYRVADRDKLQTTDPFALTLRLVRVSDRAELFSDEVQFESTMRISDLDRIIRIPLHDASVGDYRVEMEWNGQPAWTCGRFHVLSEQAEEIRRRVAQALDGIEKNHPDLAKAVDKTRDRLRLLSEQPSTTIASEFLTDQAELVDRLESDVAAMQSGRHPYRDEPRRYWATMSYSGGEWPYRVVAPVAVERDEPVPLVVALHGAGGDESMFSFGYGAGMLSRLAEEHGFLLVAPLTYPLVTAPNLIDELIEEIASLYEIADRRIYLLGHSLGGGTAAAILNERPDRFAAACGIAGFGRLAPSEGASSPPALVFAGELDSIIPAERLRTLAAEARERGTTVEFRSLPDQGHTLIVGKVLPQAVDWLLEQSRE